MDDAASTGGGDRSVDIWVRTSNERGNAAALRETVDRLVEVVRQCTAVDLHELGLSPSQLAEGMCRPHGYSLEHLQQAGTDCCFACDPAGSTMAERGVDVLGPLPAIKCVSCYFILI